MSLQLPRFLSAGLASALLMLACQTVDRSSRPWVELGGAAAPAEVALERLIEDLYVAFSFDAGHGADWEAIRQVSAPGAAFFSPVSAENPPHGVGVEQFINDFAAFIQASPLLDTGYHERVTQTRIRVFGTIAHAFVTFEAFVPGEEPDRRGVDSLQFLRRADGTWVLSSFTTQYESEEHPLPGWLRERG